MHKFPPIDSRFPHMLHGGDYNPEQWIATPEVWDEDFRLLREANCNTVSVGIFGWAALEPQEGQFEFGWLDQIFEKANQNGVRIILATPTGARPAWMAEKYPEVLRVSRDRRRQMWGARHNHCFTSPVYREKSQIIGRKLAERYGNNPALSLWHVNNEVSGECHCDLCQNAFRNWLRQRYDNDLDKLNQAWWSAFWSHQIPNWDVIESPSPIGETKVHGLNLDWRRFVTDQTIDFFHAESAPLRELTPNIPRTTNYIGGYAGLDYYKLARELDVVSWDSYPDYHDRPESWRAAVLVSFLHSQRRAMLRKPFLLMECSPGVQNYKPVCKLKRPGLHITECLQSVAHGADSVLYFQWRKSRGSVEKFHGAVVDHYATSENRVFKEVSQLGEILSRLDSVVGTVHQPEVAVIYDYENRWAIDDAAGPRNEKKDYLDTCVAHFQPFWQNGVSVDIIDEVTDFSPYKLLVAPMLYLMRPGVAERIENFVEQGGTFVTTYLSGLVDESDLCFQNGFPGPLRKLLGIWAEEIDVLYDDESVQIAITSDNSVGLSGSYQASTFCDLLHAEGAQVLATYQSEFYAGRPALTVNTFGKGKAFYIASRNEECFDADFYGSLIQQLGLRQALNQTLPQGISADVRTDGTTEWVFLLSFRRESCQIDLGDTPFYDLVSEREVSGLTELPSYASMVLQVNRTYKPD
ncbi:MAG TPA: beta-galactosidase [Abditibacteriaceae bacterium]|jgi:beta-galactosidase